MARKKREWDDGSVEAFWHHYLAADILERERMLKNPVRLILSSAKLPKKHQERAVTMTLLSYLDDFEQVLRSERK